MPLTADPNFIYLLALSVIWVLPWKGYALWLAARRGEKVWFIILLIVNTLAILEIIYIFFVAKRDDGTGYESEDNDGNSSTEIGS